MDDFLIGAAQIFTFATLAYMLAGSVAGILAAAIPGFTVTMAIVLTLPLTFAMEPLQGIAVMLSVYVGGYTGGLISAALLGIPGTPSSVATTFDAFPMARSGEPGRALSIGVWASFFGTVISTIVLIFAAPPLALFAVRLGPWEYFSLIVFALTVVGSLVGSSVIRGMLAGLVGLAISTVGTDPMLGRPRFDFGIEVLQTGFPFLVVLIGIFAISQLVAEVEDADKVRSGNSLVTGTIDFQTWKVMKEVLMRPVNLVRSSIIGVLIGALPGAGGSIANLVAYDQAKRASKHPENFGKGETDGIVASEAGNSATAGGGLIPLIGLGIPGSAVDAILMASLMVHGISVGPRLILDNGDLVYGMFIAMAVSSLMMLVVAVFSMRLFLRVTEVPKWLIVPVVMTCCVVGTFALNNRVTDLYLLIFIGIAGYTMRALGYSLAPLVLGVILGPIAETNLRRALMTDPDLSLFLTRPISLIFLIAALLSIAWAIRSHLKTAIQLEGPPMHLRHDPVYPSRRSPVLAENIVATSQPLAAQAGLLILQQGGNAVDAAVATAATLTIVEPTGCGLGSDAFCILWDGKKLHGLNASGRAPGAWTPERFPHGMPQHGWDSVTVPGVVSAWVDLSERFGKLGLATVLAPAIRYAEQGFIVSPVVGTAWAKGAEVLKDQPGFAETFNGQGIAALMALGILQHTAICEYGPDDLAAVHLQIEAIKLAYRDLHTYVADRDHMGEVDETALLDPAYLKSRAALIDSDKAQNFGAGAPKLGGTVLLNVGDASGMMVSFIQSNYAGFGSGVVVPGTGVSMQNRGSGFTTERGHPNQVAPGKRPFHTIIPGFAMKDGKPLMAFGMMGGPIQAQGHVQLLLRTQLWQQDPQTAADAPRWRTVEGLEIACEPTMPKTLLEGLAKLGHKIKVEAPDNAFGFGGAQIVQRFADGSYVAGSDPRKDGQAGGF